MDHAAFREEVENLSRLLAMDYASEVQVTYDMEGDPEEGLTPYAEIRLELFGGNEYKVQLGIRKDAIVIIGNDDSDSHFSADLEGAYTFIMLEANSRLLVQWVGF